MSAIDYFDNRAAVFLNAYSSSKSFMERFQVWSRLIEKYCPKGSRVLDVGCGPGVFTLEAARNANSVVAIDGSLEMLSFVETKVRQFKLRNVETRQLRLDEIPQLGTGQFDFMICSSVLDYSVDLTSDLDNLTRGLAKGGRILLSLPNAWCFFRHLERLTFRLFGWPKNVAHIKNVKTAAFLRKEMRARGMDVIATHYYGSALKLSYRLNFVWPRLFFNTLFVLVCERTDNPQ